MYKIVIADDEPHIIEGLKVMFDWNASGFEIAGTAANGLDAYETIIEQNPDVAMIDIRMPGYDGLELSKKLRESGYNGGIIILTAYAEISYAREGIKYGVKYFLDKPIDNDELKNILADFKKEFDSKMRRESFVSSMVEEKTIDNSNHHDKWCVMCVRLIKPIAVNNLPENVCLYEHSLGVQSYVISNGRDIADVVNLFFRQILSVNPQAVACVVYSDSETGIKKCYETAIDSLTRIVKPLPGTLYTESGQRNIRKNTIKFSEFVKQLTEYIEFGDDEAAKQCIDSIFNAMAEEEKPMIYAHMLYNYMSMYISSVSDEPVDSGYVDTDGKDNVMFGLADYYERTLDICSKIIKIIVKTERSGKERIFDMVERYIKTHFREDIVIKDIASIMYMSPGYLGALFTKEKGMSIKEYIHHLRMSEAEKLMKESEKTISDIAYEVGYNNYNHFYTQFERHFGMTPIEYRKKLK